MKRTLEFAGEMNQQSMHPDAKLYTAAIEACRRCGLHEHADELIEELL